ncbi:Hypothetical predicted protein [Mytilus galloprovincialis]|uniref:Schlafen AlbA-2 domain-containing protein n=1 Tax=Mytilus galloprovincialis TaxID=29158 RepID=A0A8B6C9G7_MYTGA|nr:Hypothetical predicted protein [Mytilus galloprovincialis]
MKLSKEKQRSAVICHRSPTEVTDVLDRLRNRSSRNSLGFSFQRIADMYVHIETELPAIYYRKGQHIRKETRQMEFKLGGEDYVRNNLRKNVSKYSCGYLNGRTEGTLFSGVDDKGHVVGVNCENEDQSCRSYIDESIRDIKPPVDNKDYQVEFVPVEEDGQNNKRMSDINHIVIIRKLTKSNSIRDSNLTDSIYDILNTYMKIATIRNCIQIKTVDNNQKSALIRLKSLTEVLNALKDTQSRNSLGFKFQRIADTGETIEVKNGVTREILSNRSKLRDENKEINSNSGEENI